MALTREDLQAIREVVKEELEPVKTDVEVLKADVEILKADGCRRFKRRFQSNEIRNETDQD